VQSICFESLAGVVGLLAHSVLIGLE